MQHISNEDKTLIGIITLFTSKNTQTHTQSYDSLQPYQGFSFSNSSSNLHLHNNNLIQISTNHSPSFEQFQQNFSLAIFRFSELRVFKSSKFIEKCRWISRNRRKMKRINRRCEIRTKFSVFIATLQIRKSKVLTGN